MDIILTILGVYFAFQLFLALRAIYKARRDIARDYRRFGKDLHETGSDFARLWRAFRRGRRSGLGVEDAIASATDEISGKTSPAAEPKPKQPRSFLGIVFAILINSISILGVYQFGWSVGTGLALYWAENVLTGLIVIARNRKNAGEVAVITVVFNGAHFLFLLAFLGVTLPKIAPAERFNRESFEIGLLFIAILLAVEFIVSVIRKQTMPATSYLQRVTVLHLTIIIGMFALALFGQARAFFAVFAGLKLIVDAMRRA